MKIETHLLQLDDKYRPVIASVYGTLQDTYSWGSLYPLIYALIINQILLTYSFEECIEISLENLYVDTGA